MQVNYRNSRRNGKALTSAATVLRRYGLLGPSAMGFPVVVAPHASLALPRGTVNFAASNIAQTSRRWLFPPPLSPSFGGRRLEAACSHPLLMDHPSLCHSEPPVSAAKSGAGLGRLMPVQSHPFKSGSLPSWACCPWWRLPSIAACGPDLSRTLGPLGSRYFGATLPLPLRPLPNRASRQQVSHLSHPWLFVCSSNCRMASSVGTRSATQVRRFGHVAAGQPP